MVCLGVPWLPFICNTILRWTILSWFCWLLVLVPHPRLVQSASLVMTDSMIDPGFLSVSLISS